MDAVLFVLAPISYGRIIYEVTSVTLGSLLLDRLPKSKPFTPLFSCQPAARGLPATYDLTPINTREPTRIPGRRAATVRAGYATLWTQPKGSGRWPYWMPMSSSRSRMVTGPGSPEPIVQPPDGPSTAPTGV